MNTHRIEITNPYEGLDEFSSKVKYTSENKPFIFANRNDGKKFTPKKKKRKNRK